MRPKPLLRVLVLFALLPACHPFDDGEVDEPGGSLTWYSAVPTPSGDGLAIVVDPVLDHTVGEGVLVTGFSLTDVGPSIAIDAQSAAHPHVLGTFGTGITKVLLAPSAAFVFQSDTATWTVPGPYLDPPPVTFPHVTRVDRASWAVTGARDLVPPAEAPVVLGDGAVVDLPQPGASDAARDVFVRVVDLDAAAPNVLHAAQGFGAASCAGDHAVALAYEPADAPGSTVVVSARHGDGVGGEGDWTVATATIAGVRLDPTGIACSADASRVLLSVFDAGGRSHVYAYDVAATTILVDAADAQGPFAMRSDGAAFAATGTDGSIAWHDAKGARRVATHGDLADPVVLGDLALWDVDGGVAIVHLADGSVDATVPLGLDDLGDPAAIDGTGARPVAWPSGGGFVVATTTSNMETYRADLTRLFVVTPAGVTDLPLPAAIGDASIVAPVASTMFVIANVETSRNAGVDLVTYDLGAGALRSETAFVQCDPASVRAKKGCLP